LILIFVTFSSSLYRTIRNPSPNPNSNPNPNPNPNSNPNPHCNTDH